MAFEVVPLDNAELAVMVGRAEPGRPEFDSAVFNGTDIDNGRFDGAVPPDTPVEANAIGLVKELEDPKDVGPEIG